MAEGEKAEERWLPIESNPEVMNSFLKKLGVPDDWEINDLFGLDPELLLMLPQPVLALLLLFPITEKYESFAKEQEAAMKDVTVSDKLYYMKQTVSNACGTVALMHAVINNTVNGQISLRDGLLKRFVEATKDLSAEERAVRLEADDDICGAHDEAAREGQTRAPDREDQVDYHFVCFVPVDGDLYELDGRKSGPIKKAKCSSDTFLSDAAAACKEYMVRDPDNINFTIVALTAKMD